MALSVVSTVIATLLVGAAAELPDDVDVELVSRPGTPFVTAALALPRGDVDPAHLPVLAALLSGERVFDGGPVAALRLTAGSLVASATPDGLVVVADGPSERAGLVLSALAAVLAPLDVDERAVVLAQARVLEARRDERETAAERARALAFTLVYGDPFGAGPPKIDDIALHRLDARVLGASLAALQRGAGRAVVVEGRLDDTLTARALAAPPETRAHVPLPRALDDESATVTVRSASAAPRVILAWPVPGALVVDDAHRLLFCAALEDALAGLGRPEVRVVGSASRALALVELGDVVDREAATRDARARLAAFRDTPDPKRKERASERARDALARLYGRHGAVARARARARLVTTTPIVDDGDLLWARALVVPEVALALHVGPPTTSTATGPATTSSQTTSPTAP